MTAPALSTQVITFIERYCRVNADNARGWAPMVLDPWQRSFIRAWLSTGDPFIARAILSVARKNGKTELAAAIVLAAVAGPLSMPGQRVVSAAGRGKEQAGLVFERCERMIRLHPMLAERLEVTPSRMRFHHKVRLSYYEALPATAASVMGRDPWLWVLDELAQAKSLDLFDALNRGQGALPSRGRGLIISTYSDAPGNPLAELIDAVQRGQANGKMQQWLLRLYTADPTLPVFSWKAIKQANPGLGTILIRSTVEDEIEEARYSASQRTKFRSYRLNQNVEAMDALIDLEQWQSCLDSVDLEALEGEPCYLGLDLSSVKDLTALAAWFPQSGVLVVWCWLPEENLGEREMEDKAPYREWAKSGDLLTTPGPVIDRAVIFDFIRDLQMRFKVLELRYDRHRLDKLFAEAQMAALDIEMLPFGQGTRDMGPAIEDLEEALELGIRIQSNPVLNMCARNCGVQWDALMESRRPVKQQRELRIDGIVAGLMAISRRPRDVKPVATQASDFVLTGLYE